MPRCPACVRPVNGIFKAKEGFGKMDRGSRPELFTNLFPHDHAEFGRLADASGRGRAPLPRASLGEDRLGAQGRAQASAASPDWCH